MVLGGQGDVLGAGARENIGPVCGVEELSVELRSEVGVRVVGAIKLFVHLPATGVNRARIRLLPFRDGVPVPLRIGEFARDYRCIGGHRVDAPVDENAELGIGKPCRNRTAVERIPASLIGLRA